MFHKFRQSKVVTTLVYFDRYFLQSFWLSAVRFIISCTYCRLYMDFPLPQHLMPAAVLPLVGARTDTMTDCDRHYVNSQLSQTAMAFLLYSFIKVVILITPVFNSFTELVTTPIIHILPNACFSQ